MTGICYHCGQRLVGATGRPIIPVHRVLDGNPIKLHQGCAKTFDADHAALSARAVTSPSGNTYLSEKHVSTPEGVSRLVVNRNSEQ